MFRSNRYHYSLTILFAFIILLLSLSPSSSFPRTPIPRADLIVHATMYAALMFVLLLDVCRFGKKTINVRRYWWLLFLPIGWGILMELCQMLTQTRSASWSDVGANIVGTLIGAIVFRLFSKCLKRRGDG